MSKEINSAWVRNMKHKNMQDNFSDFWREIYCASLRDRMRLAGRILFTLIIARIKGVWTIVSK